MSLIDDLTALIFQPSRGIGTIIPHVTIRENHQDETAITVHPVENGAAVSDHAFRLPAQLDLQVGWSDSTAGRTGASKQAYARLLALQNKREPFDVYTGKRRYKNMLIRGITTVTDETSEHALMAVVRLQEVLITTVQRASAPQSAQSMPESTSGTQDRGTQNGQPVSPSSGDGGGSGGSGGSSPSDTTGSSVPSFNPNSVPSFTQSPSFDGGGTMLPGSGSSAFGSYYGPSGDVSIYGSYNSDPYAT